MNIKYIKFVLCIVLIHASAHTMQQQLNYYASPENIAQGREHVRMLWQAINALAGDLRDQDGYRVDRIDFNITQAQNELVLILSMIQPELDRERRTNECHTVIPVIDGLLSRLSAKLAEMRGTLIALQHYDVAIDGEGNVPLATMNAQNTNVIEALEIFFGIINQQPDAFERDPRTPTFAQCLQATSLAKKRELARIIPACYQRWFAQPQPIAPAQAAPAPGQANMVWQNFFADVYMRWLINLDNIHLLIDTLADYLTPDAVIAADQPLRQGQEAIHALATEHVQNFQGDVGRLAEIGRQMNVQLERMQANAGNLDAYLGAYAQLIHDTILHRYTREQRLGDPHFRTWLETMATTWEQTANQAAPEHGAH